MDTQLNMFASDTLEVTARFNDAGQILVTFAQKLTTRQIRQFAYSPVAYVPAVKEIKPTFDCVPSGCTGVLFTLKPNAAKDAFLLRGIIAQYAREWIAAREPQVEQISLF